LRPEEEMATLISPGKKLEIRDGDVSCVFVSNILCARFSCRALTGLRV